MSTRITELSQIFKLDPMWLNDELWMGYYDLYEQLKKYDEKQSNNLIEKENLRCCDPNCPNRDNNLKVAELYYCSYHLEFNKRAVKCLKCKNKEMQKFGDKHFVKGFY